jgi:hypothetical protein
MRCPIHVDENAEIFARVIMTDKPQHWVYNSGGQAISLGDLADIVRGYLPDAQISFDKETGGRELSGNYLIDNTRLVSEFGVQCRPYRERVLQIINDVRKEEGLPGHDALLRHPVGILDPEVADHKCLQMRSRTKETISGLFGRFFSLRFLTQKEQSHGTRL